MKNRVCGPWWLVMHEPAQRVNCAAGLFRVSSDGTPQFFRGFAAPARSWGLGVDRIGPVVVASDNHKITAWDGLTGATIWIKSFQVGAGTFWKFQTLQEGNLLGAERIQKWGTTWEGWDPRTGKCTSHFKEPWPEPAERLDEELHPAGLPWPTGQILRQPFDPDLPEDASASAWTRQENTHIRHWLAHPAVTVATRPREAAILDVSTPLAALLGEVFSCRAQSVHRQVSLEAVHAVEARTKTRLSDDWIAMLAVPDLAVLFERGVPPNRSLHVLDGHCVLGRIDETHEWSQGEGIRETFIIESRQHLLVPVDPDHVMRLGWCTRKPSHEPAQETLELLGPITALQVLSHWWVSQPRPSTPFSLGPATIELVPGDPVEPRLSPAERDALLGEEWTYKRALQIIYAEGGGTLSSSQFMDLLGAMDLAQRQQALHQAFTTGGSKVADQAFVALEKFGDDDSLWGSGWVVVLLAAEQRMRRDQDLARQGAVWRLLTRLDDAGFETDDRLPENKVLLDALREALEYPDPVLREAALRFAAYRPSVLPQLGQVVADAFVRLPFGGLQSELATKFAKSNLTAWWRRAVNTAWRPSSPVSDEVVESLAYLIEQSEEGTWAELTPTLHAILDDDRVFTLKDGWSFSDFLARGLPYPAYAPTPDLVDRLIAISQRQPRLAEAVREWLEQHAEIGVASPTPAREWLRTRIRAEDLANRDS